MKDYQMKDDIMKSVLVFCDSGYTIPQGREIASYYPEDFVLKCVVGVHFVSNPKLVNVVLFNGKDPHTGIQVLPPHNSPLAAFEDFWKVYQDYYSKVQFNIVDSKMLKEAQKHPDQNRDLLVRVSGFTQYWVETSKPVQDEVIARTEFEGGV